MTRLGLESRRRADLPPSARHAADQTCWTMWREAGYAPGRTCSIHASCGTREAGHGDAMSELSDAVRRGSRQTRRDASMARSKAQKRSGCASDNARRRGSAMDGAGEPGRGAGANEERRQASPNALESAKRGSNRGRSGTEPSRLRRVAQDCDPKTYSCMSSGRKDARIAKARRRVPLPRFEPHVDKAGKTGTSASSRPRESSNLNFAMRGCAWRENTNNNQQQLRKTSNGKTHNQLSCGCAGEWRPQ